MLKNNRYNGKYRLVTRSDFDGLVCAVLLQKIGLIGDVLFVHPKDMQDGKIDINEHDITTNLPYVESCYLAFDHHWSEVIRIGEKKTNHIINAEAMSAARVVYNYYGGKDKFSSVSDEMMYAVDKCDAAKFSFGEILNPKGWVLLSFIMDARTGLGRFKNFRVSNYQLMMDLIGYCHDHNIDDILQLPDIKERVDMYFEHEPLQREQIKRCATVYDRLVVLDFRTEEVIYAGNRFMVYALFPECDISMHQLWRIKNQTNIFAVGKSIIDRRNKIDIGTLMLRYGGGGHRNAGTCQVEQEHSETVFHELISILSAPDDSVVNEDLEFNSNKKLIFNLHPMIIKILIWLALIAVILRAVFYY